MRLEGTLDAFSLPDIFQLLSFTKKTGTLHLRRDAQHGVVHVREGAITGARSDASRQALGRRLVGSGLVDDAALSKAVVRVDEATGLARVLAQAGAVDADVVRALAAEQATDAVFDLLRWPDGEFAFVVDEADPDDLGAVLAVEDVVAEARRRLDAWPALTEAVPAPDAVVQLVPLPHEDPQLTRDEWALLALVDGRRTVIDLVDVSGRGEYAVVSALAGLVQRGLVTVSATGTDLAQRQALLAQLEGVAPAAPPAAPAAPAAPAQAAPPAPPRAPSIPAPAAPAARKPVIPERPEPFTAPRQPDHPEPAAPAPSYARASSAPAPPPAATVGATVGEVHGATAMQPAVEAAPSPYIERDPSVNKSLLLRLIAGVRGL